ncbi:MAG: 3-phosphoshikimate 1-carboxyvinyltransferase [Calditrichaceae bacterium]|nr:3-phosphoshikimate 1-carboxyvinyltransferase [Calditrichia bacterium]NUQ41572.1 3-phosphoshikimate 1-carboxyvinyltransferase [Calditrichaceae bacterium]
MYRILPKKITEKTVSLPPSKSLSHRMAILAGLNRGRTVIENFLCADDTEITLNALRNMGMEARRGGDRLAVSQPIERAREGEIYLGNSGSSARFLLPLGAFLDQPVRFYGEPRLHQRPFEELFAALGELGIRFSASENSLPATVYPGKMAGGAVGLKNLRSSQAVTALMLAGLWMDSDLVIHLPEEIPSAAYIRMTHQLMARLGLEVESAGKQVRVKAERPAAEWNYTVEKDLSAASYWVVLGLIHEARIILPGVRLPSLQGDERIFSIAQEAGAEVVCHPDRVEIQGGVRRGLDLDCREIPDLVPALSVLGLFSPAPARLRNVSHLSYKESNRIEAIQQNIAAIGGSSEYREGGLTILPAKRYRGAVISTFNDHRIAMSFALAGSRIAGIVIDNPGCVSKSYPGFWRDFEK